MRSLFANSTQNLPLERLCDILDAHMTGIAHDPDGIVSQFVQQEPDAGSPTKIEIVDGVAVIPVHGVIGHGYSTMLNSSGVLSVDVLGALVTEAVENEMVRGIMLDVNSPVGTVTGVPEAAKLIRDATAVKPVVAFTDSLMASAAMWLASGANAIYATQSASVGSIGVYMRLPAFGEHVLWRDPLHPLDPDLAPPLAETAHRLIGAEHRGQGRALPPPGQGFATDHHR